MSRIGKKPILIPDKVKLKIDGQNVFVEGPKGKLDICIDTNILTKMENNQLVLERNSELKSVQALHGLYRSLINNMVEGVLKGFEKKLEIIGVGYRASVQGKKLTLNVGFSHPYEYSIPDGISISVENNTNLIISGIDKEQVGQVAADIRRVRPPEPYKGKGIKYSTETIRRKIGKSGVK